MQAATIQEICRKNILNEFAQRRQRKGSYSLRAYARDLGISTTTLCDVLAGKRTLSKKNLNKVICTLSLEQTISKEFYGNEIDEPASPKKVEDNFSLISHWYFFAILSLARIKNIPAEERFIANRLGISIHEARNALEVLTNLKMIRVRKGCLIRTSKPITTTQDIPSEHLKRHHSEVLDIARLSLFRDTPENRYVSGTTMAIDPKRLETAKKIISEFQERLSTYLEKGTPSDVYTLSLQLFPLNKKESPDV